MDQLHAIRAVVFDLDDTLYPEMDFVRSGFRAVGEAFTDPLGPPDAGFELLCRLFETGDRRRVFDAALAAARRAPDRDTVQRMVQVYRAHLPRIALHPDADRALMRLSGFKRLGLLTDGPAQTQRNKINALGLSHRVHAIILTDELGPGRGKPDPCGFEQAAAQLACRPTEMAYVGDNPAKDFIAPNALGWLTIQIVRSDGIYRDATAPPTGAAQLVIDTLDRLPWQIRA